MPPARPRQAQAQVQPQLDKQPKQIEQRPTTSASRPTSSRPTRACRTCATTSRRRRGVKTVTQPLVNKDGTAAVMHRRRRRPRRPTRRPRDLVPTLRDDVIPEATKGQDMTAYVGGTTASYVDLADEISSRLVLTIALVVALSFVLLTLAFRSLVIPLTAG